METLPSILTCYAITKKSGDLQDGNESDFLIYKKREDAYRVRDEQIGEKVRRIEIKIISK